MSPMYQGITPIHFMNDFYVKREDLAFWSSLDYPSGSKVRQYFNMVKAYVPQHSVPGHAAGYSDLCYSDLTCLVGCSANSCQQVYLAATSKILGMKGIVYTAKRKIRSEATLYAENLGCEIVEVRPAYLSVIRKAARQRAIDEKNILQWDRKAAILDTAAQCENLPADIQRIIVPTGSGLTAAGVLLGIAQHFKGDSYPSVVIVATSPMASPEKVMQMAMAANQNRIFPMSPLEFIHPSTPYDVPVIERLPDGTPLDCFYAGKALKYLTAGNMIWLPGLRPVVSMPKICQDAFQSWKGPT